MTGTVVQEAGDVTLRKGVIGVWGIIFLTLATNGPLTVLLGSTPAAIAFGNGIGLPSTFLIIGGVYLVFSVGFAAMAHHIKNAGAFYAYVSSGLGRKAGVGAAFMAITAYTSLNLALYGMLGFFASHFITSMTGIVAPWWVACVGVIGLVHVFSTRNIEFNGRLLSMLMIGEVAIIVLLDVTGLRQGGPAGYSMASFEPSMWMVPGLGASAVFVVASFMGFETAAIYGEEAKNPKRTIPIAIYASVFIIMALYAGSTWIMIVAYGPKAAFTEASIDPGNLWFLISSRLLGHWSVDVLQVLMNTSLFAAILSFQNALSRYYYSLGREGVLWNGFARLHPREQTPVVAGSFQTAIMLVGVVVSGLAGVDPLRQLMPIAAAPSSLAIVAVQFLAAISVIGFFRRSPEKASIWARLVAPLLSALALGALVIMMASKMNYLTGGMPQLDAAIPVVVFGIGLFGALYARWLQSNKPTVYEGLTRVLSEA